MNHFYVWVVLTGMFLSCSKPEDKVDKFVRNEFALFPESHFVDIYKSFFQDAYGPGHIIPDTLHAGKYVDEELLAESWPDTLLWQATGALHDYYRINLVLVKKGIIPRDTLLLAMVRSARLARKPAITGFKKEVDEIYRIVTKIRPGLPDLEKDYQAICEQLDKGEVMMHHSDHYLQTYQRRYRIIHRTVFDAWKNSFLKNL